LGENKKKKQVLVENAGWETQRGRNTKQALQRPMGNFMEKGKRGVGFGQHRKTVARKAAGWEEEIATGKKPKGRL